ncbi:DUF3429 domain-containing protein [Asticcacaulis sp. DXS10W]|uniref:DUF3429 domain-containing protein n=1 Tax=Asticcacaulis currens TaxID=2984210 RepID=A0ABT5IEU2_9CAUL|nr:DUF3429 domain-containing protein [Asticcacaulis currens]MDC7694375.1 DUF3429 domain-containing protein [Asticcacaulis currens]
MDDILSKKESGWIMALTLSGGLPFGAAALMAVLQRHVLGLDGTGIAVTYGAVIASFLCGLHWGLVLGGRAQALWLLILSNLLCLLAWCGPLLALTGHARAALGIEVAVFLSLLAVDTALSRRGWLSGKFLRLRVVITSLVVACLIVVALLA